MLDVLWSVKNVNFQMDVFFVFDGDVLCVFVSSVPVLVNSFSILVHVYGPRYWGSHRTGPQVHNAPFQVLYDIESTLSLLLIV